MERIAYDIEYGDPVTGAIVVDLAVAKQNSNIEHSETEAFLQLLLDAAVQEAEDYICNPLLKRKVYVKLSKWITPFLIPVYPVSTIDKVSYMDADGATQEMVTSDYKLKDGQLIIALESLPELGANDLYPVTIELTAGYENNKMPKQAVGAVIMRFSHKELFREDVPTSYNRAFHSALRPLKRW